MIALRRLVLGLGLVLLAAVTMAVRHGMLLSAETTTDRTVRLGAFFDDGSPMVGAKVVLKDRTGAIVIEGKANEAGYLVWSAPTAGHYVLTADDGAGHQGRQSFAIATFQLDGAVRDLIEETGREPTVVEQIRALPRWLTAAVGLVTILAIFSLIAWRRTARELAALRAGRS